MRIIVVSNGTQLTEDIVTAGRQREAGHEMIVLGPAVSDPTVHSTLLSDEEGFDFIAEWAGPVPSVVMDLSGSGWSWNAAKAAGAKCIVKLGFAGAGDLAIATSEIYGVGHHGDVPKFIDIALSEIVVDVFSDGRSVTDYVHCSVVAQCFLAAAEKLMAQESLPELIEVGSGYGRRTKDVARDVGVAVGKPIHIRWQGPPGLMERGSHRIADTWDMEHLLGVEPTDQDAQVWFERLDELVEARLLAG